MGVHLTPGQRCLLDLMQRKLYSTLYLYAKLTYDRSALVDEGSQVPENVDFDLVKLKEKIRRISAKQKRFTLEILQGNGNNTIPKESFFQALGLITRDALQKLNSKTNERRRRTTANPRFSHEAIQAKKALEPLQKRLEPRASKERKQQQQQADSNSTSRSNKTIQKQEQRTNGNGNIRSSTTTTSTTRSNETVVRNVKQHNNNAASRNKPNNRTTNSSKARANNINKANQQELLEYREIFKDLRGKIKAKISAINNKVASNALLEADNEIIRLESLELVRSINELCQNDPTKLEENPPDFLQVPQEGKSKPDLLLEPHDVWLKCDESLSSLD